MLSAVQVWMLKDLEDATELFQHFFDLSLYAV